MSTARKVLSNTAYQLFGRFTMAALAVIIVKLITRYLGVAGYGEYVTVYEYLGFFAIFADMGIYTIAVREMSVHEDRVSAIIGNIMGLRATLAWIMMLFAIIIAFLLPQYQNSAVPIGIAIAGVTTFFTMLQGTICSVLQIRYKMQYSMLSMILGKIVSVLYTIFVIFYLYPVGAGQVLQATDPAMQAAFWHLIFGGLLGSIVMYGVSRYYVHKFEKFSYQFDLKYWFDVLKTAVPYGLALILNNIYFKVDVLLLSLLLPKATASVQTGIYGVAMRILEMLVIIPVYFMNSVLPIMMKMIKEKTDKIYQLIQYSFDFLIAAGLPILAGIGVLAIEIVKLISTDNFASQADVGIYGSDVALQILMFALVFSFINSLFGFILVALEKQIKLLWINSTCVVFNFVGNALVIPWFGFVGAACTSVLTELFILICTFWITKKYLKFKIKFGNAFKILFSALLMAAVVFFLKPFFPGSLWVILIPVGALVYAAGLTLTGAVTKEMRRMVIKSKGK